MTKPTVCKLLRLRMWSLPAAPGAPTALPLVHPAAPAAAAGAAAISPMPAALVPTMQTVALVQAEYASNQNSMVASQWLQQLRGAGVEKALTDWRKKQAGQEGKQQVDVARGRVRLAIVQAQLSRSRAADRSPTERWEDCVESMQALLQLRADALPIDDGFALDACILSHLTDLFDDVAVDIAKRSSKFGVKETVEAGEMFASTAKFYFLHSGDAQRNLAIAVPLDVPQVVSNVLTLGIELSDALLRTFDADQLSTMQPLLSVVNRLFACVECCILRFVVHATPQRSSEVLGAAMCQQQLSRLSGFSRKFNRYLQLQSPPMYHPPCCMLCRRMDDLIKSTSHVISKCILNLFDEPETPAQEAERKSKQKALRAAGKKEEADALSPYKNSLFDCDDCKWKYAAACMWPLCCSDCEGMFSSQGETCLKEWLVSFFLSSDPQATAAKQYTPSLGSIAPPLQVSPLFHSVVGICCRAMLKDGSDAVSEAQHVAYEHLLESVRVYMLRFLKVKAGSAEAHPHASVPDYDALSQSPAPACVAPTAPLLYCFASPHLLSVLLHPLSGKPRGSNLGSFCGIRIFYFVDERNATYAYVHFVMWGLHFLMLQSDFPKDALHALLDGAYPTELQIGRTLLDRHRVYELSLCLFLGNLPSGKLQGPNVLASNVKQWATSQSEAMAGIDMLPLAGDGMQVPLGATTPAPPMLAALLPTPWWGDLDNYPGYVSVVQTPGTKRSFCFINDPSIVREQLKEKAGKKQPKITKRPKDSIVRVAGVETVCRTAHLSVHLYHDKVDPAAGSQRSMAMILHLCLPGGAQHVVSYQMLVDANGCIATPALGGLTHSKLPAFYTTRTSEIVAAALLKNEKTLSALSKEMRELLSIAKSMLQATPSLADAKAVCESIWDETKVEAGLPPVSASQPAAAPSSSGTASVQSLHSYELSPAYQQLILAQIELAVKSKLAQKKQALQIPAFPAGGPFALEAQQQCPGESRISWKHPETRSLQTRANQLGLQLLSNHDAMIRINGDCFVDSVRHLGLDEDDQDPLAERAAGCKALRETLADWLADAGQHFPILLDGEHSTPLSQFAAPMGNDTWKQLVGNQRTEGAYCLDAMIWAFAALSGYDVFVLNSQPNADQLYTASGVMHDQSQRSAKGTVYLANWTGLHYVPLQPLSPQAAPPQPPGPESQ